MNRRTVSADYIEGNRKDKIEMQRRPERVFDEYLVCLSQAGSDEAIEHLARRWTPRLLRFSARMLGTSPNAAEAARDIVQDTWISVIRGLSRLQDPAQFPAWIYSIARRRCADVIRADIRRRKLDERAKTNDLNSCEAANLSDQANDSIDLASKLSQLPPEQRSVVHLFYGEDLSIEEIATVMGIPPGTVKSRLHHARLALKEHLGAADETTR